MSPSCVYQWLVLSPVSETPGTSGRLGDRDLGSFRQAEGLSFGKSRLPSDDPRLARYCTYAILLLGLAAALHTCLTSSVVMDEPGHIAAALTYWHGRFDIYSHNPPFVKLCMTLPMMAGGFRYDRSWLPGKHWDETHAVAYREFVKAWGNGIHTAAILARLVSVCFYALGAWMIGRWSAELFGAWARPLGTALWCFNPLVLAHASLATVDVGASVLGLVASRAFVQMLAGPGWMRALGAGTTLGLAVCSKFSLLVLPPVFCCLALLALVDASKSWAYRGRVVAAVAVVFVSSLFVVEACYFFTGLGQPLKGQHFRTRVFNGLQELAASHKWGICFDCVSRVLPSAFLHGLDEQWHHVETGYPVCFNGRFSKNGFWQYYLVALAMKMPPALWGLALLAAWRAFMGVSGRRVDEECLAIVPLAVFLMLQLNTSLTYLRYLLPAFPYVFVSISRAAAVSSSRAQRSVPQDKAPSATGTELHNEQGASLSGRAAAWWGTMPVVALAVWAVASVAARHPHYLGYFNELVGGARCAWPYFSHGEVDWGQDVHRLARWQRSHPNARPMRVVLFTPYYPQYPDIVDDTPDAAARRISKDRYEPYMDSEPSEGYLAISVTVLNYYGAEWDVAYVEHSCKAVCRWIKTQRPIAMVGTSILIYRFTKDDIRAWQRWRRRRE